MPKIEIDEEEYNRTVALRNTLQKVAANPKAKLLLEQAHKTVDPNAITPELDKLEAVREPLTRLEKDFEEYKAKQEKDREEREKAEKLAKLNSDFEAGRARLRRDKWTPEGIEKLEKFMEERGMVSHEDAADLWMARNPPPTVAAPTGSYGAWNFMEQPTDGAEDIKKLIETKGESEPLLRKMATEALNEVRGMQSR